MTAIELDAFKMQLIRDILAINNLEMLDMLNIPATVEELKESVERGLADIKAGRRTPSEDVFRELEKKYL